VVAWVLKNRVNGAAGEFCFFTTVDLQEVVEGGMDTVDIEEFAQAIEVKLFPEENLAFGKVTAPDSNDRRTDTFPVTDKFYHSDVEHQDVKDVVRLVEAEKTAPRDDCRRGEDEAVAYTEGKNDVQPVGLHIVLITLIDKLGECLAERVIFCLI
jgi:hypothetical protein